MKRILINAPSGLVLLYSLFSLYKILRTIAPDFTVYFGAAQSLIHHQSLYTITAFTVFNYPPISTLLFTPFSFFPYQLSQGIFTVLSYISCFVCVLLCFKIIKQKVTWDIYFLTTALFLLSFPVKFTLGMGQSNLIAYALLLLAIFLEQKKKDYSSGIFLAIAIILKPIFVFLALYFLFKKSWEVIVTCIGVGLFCLIFQQLIFTLTFSEWVRYMTHILPELMTTKGREVYYNQGLLGTISRLTTNIQTRQIVDFVGVTVVLVDVIKNIFQTKNSHVTLALLLCTLPLIDSLSWQHHFVVLLFPFIFAFYHLRKSKLQLGLLSTSYILVSANIKTPSYFVHFPVNIILSHVFWGTLLLLLLLLYIAKTLQRGK